MRAFNYTTLLAVVAALAIACPVGATPMIIDAFGSPAGGQTVCVGAGCPGGSVAASSVAASDALGGERDLLVELATIGRASGAVNSTRPGELAVSSVTGGGAIILTWDGVDADPLTLSYGLGAGAGLDLSGSQAFQYDLTVSPTRTVNVSVRFHTSAGNYLDGFESVAAGTAVGTRQMAFSTFTTVGLFDWSQVRAIEVQYHWSPAGSFAVDNFQTVGSVVPEPAPFVLTGISLLLLGLAFRRRTSSHALKN